MHAQREEKKIESNLWTCTFEEKEGRLDGKYTSYYKNGQKKAEGFFENNYRHGNWTVWDQNGNIKVQRYYSTPFSFAERPGNIINQPYTVQYNSDGYIEYFNIEETDLVFRKRLWRLIPQDNNAMIFENNNLFNVLNKNIQNKNIKAYSPQDDEFKQELTDPIDASHLTIIGYKIKEDFFIDKVRMTSEYRIVGICPVALNKKTFKTVDLYWIYYPEIRKHLAQIKLTSSSKDAKVKTMDDLFFYRNFSGNIYKESSWHNRAINELKQGEDAEAESERIELGIIEMENDSWTPLKK